MSSHSQGADGDSRVPVYPHRHIPLEYSNGPAWMAALELAAPLAHGARGLIVGPPGSGRTTVLQAIGCAVAANAPHAELHVVLVDRPIDEHMEWRSCVPSAIVQGTTSEDDPDAHADLTRIFREAADAAAAGRDVVILVDSLAALARALNISMDLDERILSGGIMATALRELRSCFGAARAYDPDGSLTVLGTATVDGDQELDTVVFEELVGTGNVDYRLSADIRAAGLFPPIDIERSGARHIDSILGTTEADHRARQRALVMQYGPSAGLAMLLEHLEQHGTLPDA